jgi:hypothetical protein
VPNYTTTCAVCGAPAIGGESRLLRVWAGSFGSFARGDDFPAYTEGGEVRVCGQTHALVLFERFLERNSFEVAQPSTSHPEPQGAVSL